MDGSQDPRGERVPVEGNAVKEVPGGVGEGKVMLQFVVVRGSGVGIRRLYRVTNVEVSSREFDT